MHRNQLLFILLATSLLVAAPALAQTPLGSSFTYQGQLKLGGSAVNDTADIEFSLWDADTLGIPVGSTFAVNNVTVVDGLFTVQLDFGVSAFNGEARWLEIAVRSPAGAGAFTPLSPRQPLTAAPYALFALNGGGSGAGDGHSLDAADGDPVDAVFVDDYGRVGIGTHTPAATLEVNGPIKSASLEVFGAASVGTPQTVLDQAQENGSTSSSTPSGWQSFTAGISGYLVSVEVRRSFLGQAAVVNIYEGQGISGVLLATSSVLSSTSSQWQAAVLSQPVPIVVGSRYTIELSTPDGIYWHYSSDNPYPGGRGDGPGGRDYRFRTHVWDTSLEPTTALKVDAAGNVGIGTDTPLAKLDIAASGDGATLLRLSNERAWAFEQESTGSNAALRLRNVFGPDKEFYIDTDGDTVFRTRDGSSAAVMIRHASSQLGIGRTPAANALEVEGDASKSSAGSWLANSDRRIKQDIRTIENALNAIDKVHLVSFEYTDEYRKNHEGVHPHRYINVIAQEFAEVFPDHVWGSGEYLPDGSEILQVDTYPLIIYSAAAIQELRAEKNAEIQSLRAENEALGAKNAELEIRLARIEAKLSDTNGGVR